jgi:hypothetical protein
MDVRAGGRRSGPIHRLGPERYFLFAPGQFQAPLIPAGSPRPREGPENHRADHILCTVALLKLGMGGREFVLEGGGDYRRPAHGGNMDYLRGWIEDIPSRDVAGKYGDSS